MAVSTDYGKSAIQDYTKTFNAATGEHVNKEDFLRLMTAQLRQQNPLSPMQDMDFTGQLAQLQALDEQVAMTKSMQAMRLDAQMQSATAMIGKYVTGLDDKGKEVTGLVRRIHQEVNQIFVQLEDGVNIEVSNINNVWNNAGAMLNDIGNTAAMVGMYVEAGIDPATKQPVQGIVQSVALVDGQVKLQLYGGQKVGMEEITTFRKPYEHEELYFLPDAIRAKVEKAQTLHNTHITGTDDKGNAAAGIVNTAELDEETGEVYLVLFGGARVAVDLATESHEPTVDEMKKHLIGYWAEGKNGKGVIEDVRLDSGSPLLVLHTGDIVAWKDRTALRSATDEEWKDYENA